MSVTRTFTVTVVSTGSGNKYAIDGVQQATVQLGEGYTYRFDQSDSSNGTGGGHPLRFSTTSDGTHGGGGSEYTVGVTTNGTPGSAGAYTQIQVAFQHHNFIIIVLITLTWEEKLILLLETHGV